MKQYSPSLLVAVFLVLGAIIAVVLWLNRTTVPPPTKYLVFAQCLASKKLTMYGATWCSHCKAERALFGDSFKYVPYIDCPKNLNLCIEKRIENYPTWIDAKGVKYEGVQSLDKLSTISDCELPVN